MSVQAGGPAFPQDKIDNHGIRMSEGGMTLRDYFAAEALKICSIGDMFYKAEWAYRMADAMLKAREQ